MQLSESHQLLHDGVCHRRSDHAELIKTNSARKNSSNVSAVAVILGEK